MTYDILDVIRLAHPQLQNMTDWSVAFQMDLKGYHAPV